MSKILAVYGTHEGQTEKVSEHIAGVLKEAGHTVEMVDAHKMANDLGINKFAGIIVGASVHQGRHDKQIMETPSEES